MTDTEQKVLALWNEVRAERGYIYQHTSVHRKNDMVEALCRVIEQYEAFRQEVSDAVEDFLMNRPTSFEQFIIPKPKPDPLVRIINEVIYAQPHGDIDEVRMAGDFRKALDAAGFEIKEKSK